MPKLFLVCLSLVAGLVAASDAVALDYVTIRQAGEQRDLAGTIQVEAADGGVLLLTRDGALWPLPKVGQPPLTENGPQMLARRSDDQPFVPLERDELARELAREFPGFKAHKTQRYLVLHNTSPAYAQWVGALFERLHAAFYTFWTRKGCDLKEPQFPLVALVFDSEAAYKQHAEKELGGAAGNIIGYYSLQTNRMTMYDLTGGGRTTAARINQILSQPGAERTVATIVHEATHQLAFNSGLQVRYADIPLWVSEGIAIYFETPDLGSSKGWRSIGAVNRVNLAQFQQSSARRAGLETMLTDSSRFRNSATAADAYAEAWAWCYFLLRRKEQAFVKYLQLQAQQAPLVDLTAEQRLAQFKSCFGEDLTDLEAEFLKYMRDVK